MYAPSDITPPQPAKHSQSIPPERVAGLLFVFFALFTCLFFSLGADADLFNPQNTARAQTRQAASRTPTTPPFTPQPTLITTPRPGDGNVRLLEDVVSNHLRFVNENIRRGIHQTRAGIQ
ncbi:MAG: hypothetical protein HS103_00920 [Anaerolineales bacterium]|nr:hypothetical protein [Anaerolineales bacterium]